MNFKLKSVKTYKGRLGHLTSVKRLPEFSMQTPNVVLYTKGGAVPHLTYDVMQMLQCSCETSILQFPLSNIYHNVEAIRDCNVSLSSFVGLPEYCSYCCIQDYTRLIPQYNGRSSFMNVWCREGRKNVGTNMYMNTMESFQPDIYVAPFDGDVNYQSNLKRVEKSAQNTISMFEECLQLHSESPVLKDKGLIAVIVGGYDLPTRGKCSKFLSEQKEVSGFLIDALYTDPDQIANVPFQKVESVVDEITKYLPIEKARLIHGPWSPNSVLKLIGRGVDIFDTSIAYLSAERGCALAFEPDFSLLNCSEDLDAQGVSNLKLASSVEKENYEICLKDDKYFDDFKPVVRGCLCLTCKKHTRAYIHHLLNTKELLASVLLAIHNLHFFTKFFADIREYLEEEYEEKAMSNSE